MGIAQNGPNFSGAWKKAAGSLDATFDKLPILDGGQFAAFYKDINANAKAGADEVAAADADAQKDSLVKVVNFMDPQLTKVGWLQFWVYMCSFGIQPEEKEYKASQGRDETEFDKFLMKKLKSGLMAQAAKGGKRKHHKKFQRRH